MDINGFVLAGGASSRMGRDKSRIELDGISLAERARKTLSSICESVREVRSEASDDPSILPDIKPLSNGEHASIVGVYSALSYSGSEWTAILACDLPFVSARLLNLLASKAKAVPEGCCAIVPMQKDGKWQPLCALYKTEPYLSVVESATENGSLSLVGLLEPIATHFVEFRELQNLPNSEQFFFNVNTPTDLQRARSLIR